MYSKSRHGRDWLGVDINSGLCAQQSAGRDAQASAPHSSTLCFFFAIIRYGHLSKVMIIAANLSGDTKNNRIECTGRYRFVWEVFTFIL